VVVPACALVQSALRIRERFDKLCYRMVNDERFPHICSWNGAKDGVVVHDVRRVGCLVYYLFIMVFAARLV